MAAEKSEAICRLVPLFKKTCQDETVVSVCERKEVVASQEEICQEAKEAEIKIEILQEKCRSPYPVIL